MEGQNVVQLPYRRAQDNKLLQYHHTSVCAAVRMKSRLEKLQPFSMNERQDFIRLMDSVIQAAKDAGITP